MKIKFESDIHLEFEMYTPNLEGIDLYILAGDIHVGSRAIPWIESLLEKYEELNIIYVMGNHEMYKENLDKLPKEIKEKIKNERLHFLDNESIVIKGTRFIGSVLWTDYDRRNPTHIYKAWNGMNDFKAIRHTAQYHRITPYIIEAKHQRCRKYIFDELDSSKEPSIVITHHCPYVLQPTEGLWAAFNVDLDTEIDSCTNLPKLWISGHTHECKDITFPYTNGEVRFMSNQKGYPGEYTGHNKDLVIEI